MDFNDQHDAAEVAANRAEMEAESDTEQTDLNPVTALRLIGWALELGADDDSWLADELKWSKRALVELVEDIAAAASSRSRLNDYELVLIRRIAREHA